MGKAWARGDFCTMAPDKLFGVDLSKCCYFHDFEYIEKNLTRKNADFLLRLSILRQFRIAGKPRLGKIVSTIYYIFARLFGWYFWRQNG